MDAGSHIDRGDEPPAGGVGHTFCGQLLVHDPAGLQGVDVAVLGAPFDVGTADRSGARFGPRAVRAADVGDRWGRPHMTLGIDPYEALEIVDYGDAAAAPAATSSARTTRSSSASSEILAAGAIPS